MKREVRLDVAWKFCEYAESHSDRGSDQRLFRPAPACSYVYIFGRLRALDGDVLCLIPLGYSHPRRSWRTIGISRLALFLLREQRGRVRLFSLPVHCSRRVARSSLRLADCGANSL